MIERAPFGRTGFKSTRTLFGAAALSRVTQKEADRTLETLLEYGVNHIDTAASYGEAELRIGPWMREHRHQFFLATKTGERRYQEAKEQIHRSLERLQVEQLDLLQLHNLVDFDEWQLAMGPGGALEAAVEARDEGLVRFIGVTGHGLEVAKRHVQSLERFDFDSVLLPYSYVMMQLPEYAADFERLVEVCQTRKVAVQTIKAITRGAWGDKDQTRATWYEPLEDQAAVDTAVHWVLGRDGMFLNTVGDIQLLPKVLEAAAGFKTRPTDDAMRAVIESKGVEPLFTA